MLYNTIIKFIVEAKHKLYGHKESAGIKKAQAQSIYPARPCTAPNTLWNEVCA